MAYPASSERPIIQIAIPQTVAATKSNTSHTERDLTNVLITWPRRNRIATAARMIRIVGNESPKLVHVLTTPVMPAKNAGEMMITNDVRISSVAAISFQTRSSQPTPAWRNRTKAGHPTVLFR